MSIVSVNGDIKKNDSAALAMSADAQELAAGARAQGARGVDPLAKIGAYGSQPGNLFKDLETLPGMPSGAPQMK